MIEKALQIPRWDRNADFLDLDSRSFRATFQATVAEIDRLVSDFDLHGIHDRDTPLAAAASEAALEAFVERLDAAVAQARHLSTCLYCSIQIDARDERARALWSEFQGYLASLDQLQSRLVSWIGRLNADDLREGSPFRREYFFLLRKAQARGEHVMPSGEEDLAAQLRVVSSFSWARMREAIVSSLRFEIEVNGERTLVPFSVVHNLERDPDRDVRRRADEARRVAWASVASPLAAALNSIAGERLILAKRRNWGHPLNAALFENDIDLPTLEAMLVAVEEALPFLRRFHRAKAQLLGLPILCYYDLEAPIDVQSRKWPFADGARFIIKQFGTYAPRLGNLAQRAFAENWIDADPRPGKAAGGFCRMLQNGESRIFDNYAPTFHNVLGLAHELGHAYHNVRLMERPPLQSAFCPLTLKETASTFCEILVEYGALREAREDERLALLNASLSDAAMYCMDVASAFRFERALFDKREARALTVDELNNLRQSIDREIYGEAVDPHELRPFGWEEQSHFYMADRPAFYNFPYTFGYLLSHSLYARYQDNRETFPAEFDAFLSSAGAGPVAELTAGFGINIRDPDFWRGSLRAIQSHVSEFETLATMVNSSR